MKYNFKIYNCFRILFWKLKYVAYFKFIYVRGLGHNDWDYFITYSLEDCLNNYFVGIVLNSHIISYDNWFDQII